MPLDEFTETYAKPTSRQRKSPVGKARTHARLRGTRTRPCNGACSAVEKYFLNGLHDDLDRANDKVRMARLRYFKEAEEDAITNQRAMKILLVASYFYSLIDSLL